MVTHWEVFDAGPTRPANERMHVTLSKKNVLVLNGNIHERLGRPEGVVLMFDKVNSVIGVNPAPATLPNAFRVKPPTRGRHRVIHASPFCRHYGITIDNTTAFLKPEIDEDGVLRLDLKATTPVKKSPLRRARVTR